MSKLQFINVFFLQWFFIRLTRCTKKKVTNFNPNEVSLLSDFTMEIGGKIDYVEIEWYALQFWIIPCTNFKKIGKEINFLKISKEKIINLH